MLHHKIFEVQQFVLNFFFHKSIEEAFPIPSHPFVEFSQVYGEQDHVNCLSEIAEGLEIMLGEVCLKSCWGLDWLIKILFSFLSGAK